MTECRCCIISPFVDKYDDRYDNENPVYTKEGSIWITYAGNGVFRVFCEDCYYDDEIVFKYCPMCGRTLS